MYFKKCLAVLLVLIMLLSAQTALAAYDKPYYIEVDVTNQIVTVYNTSDGSIARQMLCSTGMAGHETIQGVYYLPAKDRDDERSEWYSFYALDVYAKWATRIEGPYLFHSIPCYSKNLNDVVPRYVREFGMPASHGCIRMQVEDAEFIAKNCLRGTRVHIFESGELDEDLRQLLFISSYSEDDMSYQEFMGVSDDALGRGSSGTEVMDLQYRLSDLGYYDDELTGAYDNATIAAVKKLQGDLGVSETGIASDSLLKIIYSDEAPIAVGMSTIKEGKSGPVVKKLQEALKALGVYTGELDSIMDLEVTEAIQKFQTACGYTADGVATAEIQNAIYYQLDQLTEKFGADGIPTVEMVNEEIWKGTLNAKANIIIREEKSTDSRNLGKVEIGETVTVVELDGDWAKIYHDGELGYIYKKYLANPQTEYNYNLLYTGADGSSYRIGHTLEEYMKGASSAAAEMKDVFASEQFARENGEEIVNYITVNTGSDDVALNLRANADSASDVLTQVPNGTSLRVVSSAGEWTRVGYNDQIGYLMNQYLSFWEGESDALDVDYVTMNELDNAHEAIASANGTVMATVVRPEGSDSNKKLRPYLYEEPKLGADKYTTLAEGVEVEIQEYIADEDGDENWLKVKYMGQIGYMRDICLLFEGA